MAAATSAGGRPSTTICQKAVQVRSSNSAADQVEHATGKPALLFHRRDRRCFFRGLCQTKQALVRGTSPSGGRLVLPPAEMVADPVPRDRPQPGPKTVARPIAAEAAYVGGHAGEYVLDHVGRVDLAYAQLPAPAIDHRAVEIN